jgi:hypothetical protein
MKDLKTSWEQLKKVAVLSLWGNCAPSSSHLGSICTSVSGLSHYVTTIRIVEGGVQLGSLGTSITVWPIVPSPGDYDDGEFAGMKIGRGIQSTRRKPAPASLCPPQIPLEETRARTRAAAAGSQWLTAWAMARPLRHNKRNNQCVITTKETQKLLQHLLLLNHFVAKLYVL